SFYQDMLTLYQGQYPMFGHAQLMPLKVLWDYTSYWGVLCQFFFQRRLTDLGMFARLAEPLAGGEALNRDMQVLLRRAAGSGIGSSGGVFIDQQVVSWFGELNRSLRDVLTAEEFEERIIDAAGIMRSLAAEILERVRTFGDVATGDLHALARLDTAPA